MSDTLTIRLDDRLARDLEEEAKRAGISKGEIAREAIRQRLAKVRPTALDALSELRGIMNGPSDLSSNKRRLARLGRRRTRA
jgi:hypothetical protein